MANPTPDEDLAPLDDLNVALAVGGSFQTSIQHADAKAAILLTAQAGSAALVANNIRTGALALRASLPTAVVLVLLAVLLVAGLAGSLWHLGRCVRPRLAGPHGDNRFAFPQLAARGLPSRCTAVVDQRDEAWRLTAVLAGIAMNKHRAIEACLIWTAATTVATLGWLCLAGAVGGGGP